MSISRRPNHFFWLFFIFIFAGLRGLLAADAPTINPPVDKSPSRDKIEWLDSKTSLESAVQYDYVGGAGTDLGNGQHSNVYESQVSVRDIVAYRCWRAFLWRGGVEWERFGFYRPADSLIPPQLHDLNLYTGLDFRFSRKDMIRLQARPGLYADWDDNDIRDFNTPVAVAYSHMVSRNFQWAAGVSYNAWRNHRWLGGGGFRWQIDDRWKLKLMLPEPQLEYKARDDLHVFVGADFRGDSFRVSHNFGTQRGNPGLNNALMDYQEIRVGTGASWNIKPLLELNLETGYMLDRSFDFHEGGPLLTSRPAPYVSVNFQWLFEIHRDHAEEEPSLDTKSPQFQIPNLERALPNVPKIFQK